MKRILSACIEKTIHFQLKEGLEHDAAAGEVRSEVARYRASLDRNQTQYKLLDESVQPDGSVVLTLKMQYNNTPVGNYLD